MTTLDRFAQHSLSDIAAKGRTRILKETDCGEGVFVVRQGKRLLSFSSNDYLGLSHHPQVIDAATEATRHYGAGSGASRFVTGNHPLYTQLETQLAGMKKTEAALVFGSGYLANIGTIPALVGKGDLILADKLIHACMLDGAALSGAKLLRFSHNNAEACAALLNKHRKSYRHCLILTEHVFSMDGDVAPIANLYALAQKHDAWLMTDDAHGFGILPTAPANIHMGTLSKAAGSYGGYVCASTAVIEFLRQKARSVIYSTALPPATLAAASAALKIMVQQPYLCTKALENARYFTTHLGLPEANSTIVPYILGAEDKALATAQQLQAQGFLVTAIRPPTVPAGTSRLRFTFSSQQDKSDIDKLVNVLKNILP